MALPSLRSHKAVWTPTLQQLCLISIILLGILFRFAYLDSKVYWVDEVATSVRISGYTLQEVVQEISERGSVSVKELLQYQQLNPEKDLKDALEAFRQSPEHVPLYFLLARFWVQLLGSSVLSIRSLSVVLSLVALPCIYWLGLELFKSSTAGWIALLLMSVSPFYVAYAQEARPYSLWTVTILMSGIALLRSLRLNTFTSWGFYAVTLILAFYTSLLSCLIAMGQGVYVLITQNRSRTIKNYWLAASVATVAFIPWLAVIFQNFQALQDNTSWMRISLEVPAMVAIGIATILLTFAEFPLSTSLDPIVVVGILMAIVLLVLLITSIFFFRNTPLRYTRLLMLIITLIAPSALAISIAIAFTGLSISSLESLTIIGIFVALALLILVVFSLAYLGIKSSRRIWLFVLTLAAVVPGGLILIDIIQAGQSSATPRYLIPVQLALQLSVTYLFASKIQFSSSARAKKFWQSVLAILISLGVISGFLNLEKSPIYQKGRNLHNTAIATIVNQAKAPILLAEPQNAIDLLSLSHDLDPGVKIQVLSEPANLAQINPGCSKLFLFNPSNTLRDRVTYELQTDLHQIYQPRLLNPNEIYLSLWTTSNSTPAGANAASACDRA